MLVIDTDCYIFLRRILDNLAAPSPSLKPYPSNDPYSQTPSETNLTVPLYKTKIATRDITSTLVTLKIVLIWCRREINTLIILMDTLP